MASTKRSNDSPNPLRSSLCLVISYRCICVFFCIASTAYRSDLLCGKDVKDGGPCPPYENSFGPGLRTYVESGDCTNGLGESLLADWLRSGAFPSPLADFAPDSLTTIHSPLATRLSPLAPRSSGPPSLPRAERGPAFPTRQAVNMLRNATFSGFFQKSGEPCFRRKLILNMILCLFSA